MKNLIRVVMIQIAQAVVPLEKLMTKFRKPDCLITQVHVDSLKREIQDGDFLFERCDYMISNLFIPGPYKHIALYYKGYIYEAVTEGVRRLEVDEWMFKKDHVGLGRQPFFQPTEEVMDRGERFLKKHVDKGEKYQYDFIIPSSINKPYSSRWHAWFCSEFVYGWCMASCPDFEERCPLPKVLGQKKMTPDDFWNRIMPVMTFN